MASSDTDYVFGREKIDRNGSQQSTSEQETIGECLGRIGKTERQHYGLDKEAAGLLDLYIATNGMIMNRNCNYLFSDYGSQEHILVLSI